MHDEAAPTRPESVRARVVFAWSLWDWGSAGFNAVATTFVFTVYLTSELFGDITTSSAWLGWALAAAGAVVAVTAPVMGRQADHSGARKTFLAVGTALVVAALALMSLVRADPAYLPLGLVLIAVGAVAFELAQVNYNAMLSQVSTPATIGRVSGMGWGMGYLGGIVLLLVVYLGFIRPEVGLFGVTDADGMDVRVSMLVAAAWLGLFSLPLFFAVPRNAARPIHGVARGVFGAYRMVFRDMRDLWNTSRSTLYFLLASAVFRDGLAGVFLFGGVIAAGTFGFSKGAVLEFAIAANVVAGVSTFLIGMLDDRLGPKRVILGSLVGLIACVGFIFALHDGGPVVFWVFGLGLCVFVGPAQSASRTFLARLIPPGRESEVFGLYATTGRAATFLAPTAFSLFVAGFGAQYGGILGVGLVLLIGLVLLVSVRSAHRAE